jgi:hypothetical protein
MRVSVPHGCWRTWLAEPQSIHHPSIKRIRIHVNKVVSLLGRQTPIQMQKVFPDRYPHVREIYIIIPQIPRPALSHLVHLPDQCVDMIFSVAQITTLNKVLELSSVEATRGAGQFERPQEVRRLLEIGSNGVNYGKVSVHSWLLHECETYSRGSSPPCR